MSFRGVFLFFYDSHLKCFRVLGLILARASPDQSHSILLQRSSQLDIRIYHLFLLCFLATIFKPLGWKKYLSLAGLLLIACILKFFTNWHLSRALDEWLKADFVELQKPASTRPLSSPNSFISDKLARGVGFFFFIGWVVSFPIRVLVVCLYAFFIKHEFWRQSQNVFW